MSAHPLDFVGLGGAGLILVAYALQQGGRLSGEGPAFSALNALGALGVLLSLAHEFNLAAFLLEGAWLAISLAALWKRRPRARRRP